MRVLFWHHFLALSASSSVQQASGFTAFLDRESPDTVRRHPARGNSHKSHHRRTSKGRSGAASPSSCRATACRIQQRWQAPHNDVALFDALGLTRLCWENDHADLHPDQFRQAEREGLDTERFSRPPSPDPTQRLEVLAFQVSVPRKVEDAAPWRIAAVSLADARVRRDEAKKKIAEGIGDIKSSLVRAPRPR